jgi:putative ABC transport system ATP-binding protein
VTDIFCSELCTIFEEQIMLGLFAGSEAQSKGNGSNGHSSGMIDLKRVVKAYQTNAGDFMALKGIDLAVASGEFVAVIGKSGAGKSTLINMITGIDRPTSGEVYANGTAIHTLGENAMARWRGKNIGIVFQFFQRMPTISNLQNVIMPMELCGLYTRSERKERAMDLLGRVGLAAHAYKLPSAISGGQQQRVAVARALANDPAIIIADEPTGNLDSQTADAVFELFGGLIDEGKTIVLVTHDVELTRHVHRIVYLADGEIVGDERTALVYAPGELSLIDEPAA